jgi:hypothetical protein
VILASDHGEFWLKDRIRWAFDEDFGEKVSGKDVLSSNKGIRNENNAINASG